MKRINVLKLELVRTLFKVDKVFIVPHEYIDADALASSVAMSKILMGFNKKSYIILDDEYDKLDSSIKNMLNLLDDNYTFINYDSFKSISTGRDLVIFLDLNNRDLLKHSDVLDTNNMFMTIDHHNKSKNVINKGSLYIDTNSSSTSEILSELLISLNLVDDVTVLDMLLGGIYLDTLNLPSKISPKTMYIKAKLMDLGASPERVHKFFETSFESDRKVQELVSKAEFLTNNFALCISDKNVHYTKAELAKVANYLLRFKIDASFAAGLIDDELIQISARSKGKVDVCKIMEQLGGDGTSLSAATLIHDNDLDKNIKKLRQVLSNNG